MRRRLQKRETASLLGGIFAVGAGAVSRGVKTNDAQLVEMDKRIAAEQDHRMGAMIGSLKSDLMRRTEEMIVEHEEMIAEFLQQNRKRKLENRMRTLGCWIKRW